ncbi:MAG: T9SS type A sorting domain-containing protein [Phaeodactylibacter sp.]|nr:T9SS type A sorting domain-containing protein [Phaeodactylibacter sp.]MCB9295056.1 T9SS type A sorting domain-containing protein [Lewinellaceae bacterium]
MRFFFTFALFCLSFCLTGQDFEEFSELSDSPVYQPNFTSVATEEGLIYGINDATVNTMVFYKINREGQITAAIGLDSTCCGYYGDLFVSEGRYFFDGLRLDTPATRLLLELDEDLNVLRETVWEDVAPIVSGMSIWQVTTGLRNFNRGARKVVGDTLYAVVPYLLPLAFNRPYTQYEVLGLDGEVYYVRDMKSIDSLYVHYYSTMGEDAFYLFGFMAGETVPGGNDGGSYGGLIGKFGLSDGQVTGTTWFEGNFLGSGTDGCMGQYLGGKVYASSFTSSTLQGAPYGGTGCPERTVAIEVFNENLQFERGYNLPTCGFLTNGGRAFAVDEEGYIYYANYNDQEFVTYLFKFDSLLNVVWMETYDMGFPYAIKLTPRENHLIVDGLTDIFNPTLRIFRVDTESGGVVSTTELPGAFAPAFHPNPTVGPLRLNAPPERPLRVQVYGLSGRLYGTYRVEDGTLGLESLPGGTYILQMSDWESGGLVGVQRVVKR